MADEDELLKDEYLALQKAVEDFDGKALTIKAWSVTASGAALATAYLEHEAAILLVGAFGALVFWFVDALWKVNQRVYYPRVRAIEAHFTDAGAKTRPFKVSQSRREANIARPKFRRTLRVMTEPVSAFPHIAVFVAGIGLYAWAPPGPEKQVKTQGVPAEQAKQNPPPGTANGAQGGSTLPPSEAPR